MAKSKIAWCDSVWNPVVGCTKVSPGCRFCYAEAMAKRLRAMGRPEYQDVVDRQGHWTGKVTTLPDRLQQPFRWRKPRRVFVNSMSDLFHEDVPDGFIEDVWTVMVNTSHTYMVLTKRPENALAWFKRTREANHGWPSVHDNIWLGVTAENQEQADKRIPMLLEIPAAVKFVSIEPMLGPVDLECLDCWPRYDYRPTYAYYRAMYGGDDRPIKYQDGIDWVIVGCENGPNRQPMSLNWVCDVVQQCQDASVSVFVKQLSIDGKVSHDPLEWPEDLRVREWPQVAT